MSVTSWFLVSCSGTRHRLPRELIFVGREDCELMLQSRSVDKQHAVINYIPATDQHLVKDLGSLNGTFVNDLRIPEQTYIILKLSDVVRFGYDSHVYTLEKSQHIVPEEALKHEKYTSQLQMGKHAEMDDRSRPEKVDRAKTQSQTQSQAQTQSQVQTQTQSQVQTLTQTQGLTQGPTQTQEAPGPRPTPLYGQPSWWGEEDVCSEGIHPEAQNPELCDFRENQAGFSYHREASYFEIPTKDFHQHPKTPEVELHEVPTKDTDTPLATHLAQVQVQAQAPPSPPTPTPPVVQSHASFTIEFDDFTPGKIKIKDHVTKFTSRQRKQQQSLHLKPPVGTPADVMSAESKVADWLVHSDVSSMMMKKRPTCEDTYSTKSDLAVNIKTLKGHHHEDGTQSDSEDPVLGGMRSKSHHSVQTDQSEVSQQTVQSGHTVCSQQEVHPPPTVSPSTPDSLSQSPPPSHSPPNQTPNQGPPNQQPPGSPIQTSTQGPPEHLSQQAFIIEFFDDNPRKKRSQSFTHTPAQADSYSALKAKMDRRKGSERPASVHGHVPATQQVTLPLKTQGHGTPQRSSSLKREKMEGEALSSSSSTSRAPSSTTRPFGSVGKKTKLVQEFAAAFLKDSGGPPSPTRDKAGPPPMSAPPVMVSPACTHLPSPQEGPKTPTSVSYPSSPSQPAAVPKTRTPTPPRRTPASPHGQTASPARQPSPAQTSMLPAGLVRGLDPRTQRVGRNEEDDSLSDAGTYTIETECRDTEVEEARNMIDQVFGVLDSPEYSGVSSSVYRPVINEGKDEHTRLESDGSAVDPMHGFYPATLSGATTGPVQVPPANTAGLEGPKWVSRWASLADSYAEGASPPSVGESLEDSRFLSSRSMMSQSESESSQVSRTKRLLPQVPPGEKPESSTPSILIQQDSYPGPETLDREPRAPCPPESGQLLSIQDDVDPDSLSDTSRSDDGPTQERAHRTQARTTAKASSRAPGPQVRPAERVSPSPSTKSTCFYIGSDSPGKADPPQSIKESSSKTPPTTVLIRHLSGHEPRRTVKPNSSAPNLQLQDKDSVPTKDSSFVRQESFTKDRPSDSVQKKKLPHISSHPSIRDLEQRKEAAQDVFLKESDGTLFHSSGSGRSSKKGGSSSHMGDSLSGESDVDTASTVSQVSNKNTPITSVSKKRLVVSSLQKEKSSSSPSIQEKGRQLSARERLSEKRRSQVGSDASGKAEAAKRFHMRRSAGNRGSLDLSEGQPGQNWAENISSDHETGSRPSSRTKKIMTPLQKEDNGKTSKTAAQQVLTRSNSLSAPRPTRASMLRRARLGDTSDNEGAETDRGSQNSDHVGAPSKGSAEKKLSRLDILAMPRKRTGSFTTPSDNEAPPAVRTSYTGRASEPVGPTRKTSVGDARQAATKSSGAAAKQTASRTRSNGTKYSGTASRRRQKGSDYSSSSEEEYETGPGTSKPRRSSQASAPPQPHRGRTAPSRPKSISVETEDDDPQNDVDPYQNWTTHSAEIAKLSHDLAKDLAILAREIHDVAGDGDPPVATAGTPISPSSLPNTPASPISSREERLHPYSPGFRPSQLVQHLPEASLNYQKVPPGCTTLLDLDANMNEAEPGSKQRRPWNRQEVILDNLMLNPVSQLSQAIRENTEQLAEKMKVLFHNKAEIWEEIEAKINAENEIPILKTSNKEITSILQELRRVQRQLEVINTIVEPSGIQAGALAPTSTSQTKPSVRDKKPAGRPLGDRTRGGPSSSNANESTNRSSRGGASGGGGGHHMS